MSTTNTAAWLTGKAVKPLQVGPAPLETPGPKEIAFRVHAIAINPVDVIIRDQGIIVENYPHILGNDAAGVVTAIGSEVTQFKVGDRVTSCCLSGDPAGRNALGAFQQYAMGVENLTAKVPEGVKFTDAAVLPLALVTAAKGLFSNDTLALSLPEVGTKPGSRGEVLFIWGAASAVGSNAVQMAKAAGYEIAATVSAHNFDYAKSIGVDHVFDYKKDSIVNDVLEALKGKRCAGTFSSVAPPETVIACSQIAAGLEGNKYVSTVYPPVWPAPEGTAEGVTIGKNWSTEIKDDHVGPHLFHKWIPAALADGSMQCKPDAEVFGQGLESLDGALTRWSQGVSAKKIVVELP